MSTVTLRPITLADTDNIVKWRNASFVKKNLYIQKALTNNQHIEYYHRYIESGKVYQFIIQVKSDDWNQDIGTAFLKDLDSNNHKAEFGIFIGEESALGKGFGKQATYLILQYAFESLKLNRVYLTVFADNHPAVNAYLKCGFRTEGVLIEDFLRYDGFADVMVMGITRKMWKSDINNWRSYGTDQSDKSSD